MKEMNTNDTIEKLKEDIKKGRISYFSLSEEEAKQVIQSLEKDIQIDNQELKNIKEKIKQEKKKIENMKK